MPKPLIALVHHHAGLNGAELSFYDIVSKVDTKTFAIHVVLPFAGPLANKITSLGIPVTFIPQHGWRWYYSGWLGRIKFLLAFPLIWKSIRQYKKFYRTKKVALVYLNINRLFEPLLAATQCGLPVLVHFRDIPSKVTRPFVWGTKNYFYVLNKATEWIANSKATQMDIAHWTRKDIPVIYNGIDVTTFLKNAKATPLYIRPPGKKVIAMIGTFTPWKNQKDFISMAAQLAIHRNDLCFWLVGEGTERNTLKALVAKHGIEDRVTFTGFIPEVASSYSQIDILVHTMVGESFGRVLAEGMIAKVPVVAYRSGAASDLLKDGATGWLIDDYNVDAISKRVEFILDHPEVVKEVVENASEHALKSFSITRLTEEMNTVFKKILNVK